MFFGFYVLSMLRVCVCVLPLSLTIPPTQGFPTHTNGLINFQKLLKIEEQVRHVLAHQDNQYPNPTIGTPRGKTRRFVAAIKGVPEVRWGGWLYHCVWCVCVCKRPHSSVITYTCVCVMWCVYVCVRLTFRLRQCRTRVGQCR